MVDLSEVTAAEHPDFGDLLAQWRAADQEMNPGDPPVPAQELAADIFYPSGIHRSRAWLAREDGVPVGMARIEQQLDGVNEGVIEVFAATDPDHRRRGVGWALAGAALDGVADLGGTSVVGATYGEPGAAFSRALGLTHRQDDRCSRLRVADVDDEQQRRWIDDAPGRAAGYRLEGWVGVCPDRWVEPLARALDAMVDAPLDDFDYDPQPMTAAQLVDRERWWDAKGFDVVTTLALAPDGTPAGASQILASRLCPRLAHQADTGVVGAHRGHALGRWLKAENLRRARAHQPGIEVVETYNAESNPHMLAINVDMGFRPHQAVAAFQGPLDDARGAVDRAQARRRSRS
jgi:GNAT superfamily N-acetyltransferase